MVPLCVCSSSRRYELECKYTQFVEVGLRRRRGRHHMPFVCVFASARARWPRVCPWRLPAQVWSRGVWPRLDMGPLAHVLNLLEAPGALPPGVHWVANRHTDTGEAPTVAATGAAGAAPTRLLQASTTAVLVVLLCPPMCVRRSLRAAALPPAWRGLLLCAQGPCCGWRTRRRR